MPPQTVGGSDALRRAAHSRSDEDGVTSSGENGDAGQIDDLARRSLRWLVLTSLVCRVVLTVPAMIQTRGVLGGLGDRLLLLSVGVVVVDGLLIVAALRRPGLLTTRWLFAADMALTVAATVAAAVLIAPGTFLLPGRDALTGYAWGTVALWTAVRGWRTGACLVGATAVLQLAMAMLNGAAFDAAGIANLLQRLGFALMSFLVTVAIVALAYRGARLAVSAGLRAGRLAERADVLRSFHDTVLADLDAVVLATRRESRPPEERLAAVVQQADRQVALHCGVAEMSGDVGLFEQLAGLVDDFRVKGLHVQLIGSTPVGALNDRAEAVDALVGSVREALNNVVKHAQVSAATIRVTASADSVEIEITDRGRGFLPGRGGCGFGLHNSIKARIDEVGGNAEVISTPGGGTRVRLTVPTRPAVPASRAEPAAADAAVTWFPLVPLIGRALTLPIIASKLGAVIPGDADVVLVGLLIGHIALTGAMLRPGAARLLRSPLLLAADLAVAAGFYLWTAAIEPSGAILTPDGDGVWLYITCTVPFWMAARGLPVGIAVLLGSFALEAAAVGFNGVTIDAGNWILVLLHVVLVGAAATYAGLVMRMARRGSALAHSESLRVGAEAERIQVLAGLQQRVRGTWRTIAAPPERLATLPRLDNIRTAAAVMAADLRTALRSDRAATCGNGLAGQLEALTHDVRRTGLRVELVVTELTGDPPSEVVAALVAATKRSLHALAARSTEGSVVLRVTGSPVSTEVCIRDTVARTETCGEADTAVLPIGGRVDVRSLGNSGTRTTLSWSAP